METDYKRAGKIEAGLEDWGRSLLASITPERESAQLWRQFADGEQDGKLVTIDAVEPRVLRLPWELMADEGGHIFTQAIGVRRRLQKTTYHAHKPFALPVRILVVVSRPEGVGFSGHGPCREGAGRWPALAPQEDSFGTLTDGGIGQRGGYGSADQEAILPRTWHGVGHRGP